MPLEFDKEYRLEVHSSALYGRFRYAVDRTDKLPDGTTQLTNIGWYTSYKNAKHAIYEDRRARNSECEAEEATSCT